MTCDGLARRCALGFFLCLTLTGCLPGSDSQMDEKKEPHFISGKNLVSQMDFMGAIDAFERAVEANPRSASAHFELAWLYEEKAGDPAAAIYHYKRYLKFSSNPDKADLAKQHIVICSLELAKTVAAVSPLASPAQRELERVLLENKDLATRVTTLQAQLDQAKAAPVVRPQVQNPVPNPASSRLVADARRAETPVTPPIQPVVPPVTRSPSPSATRTHTTKSGELPSTIARKYSISVASLMAANPQAKATSLQVGQTLNIPAP